MRKRRLPGVSRKQQPQRTGATTVEFALCAPVFFLLFFISVEMSRVNMLMHTVDNACIQATRRGIVPGATSSDCQQAAEDILRIANLQDYSVNVSPRTIRDDTKQITVQVQVPMKNNGFVTSGFFSDASIEKQFTFNRE